MTFKESVKSVMLTNYTTMSGRASRSEYWWFVLFYLLASFVLGIIYAIVGSFMFGSEVILSKKFGLIFNLKWMLYCFNALHALYQYKKVYRLD